MFEYLMMKRIIEMIDKGEDITNTSLAIPSRVPLTIEEERKVKKNGWKALLLPLKESLVEKYGPKMALIKLLEFKRNVLATTATSRHEYAKYTYKLYDEMLSYYLPEACTQAALWFLDSKMAIKTFLNGINKTEFTSDYILGIVRPLDQVSLYEQDESPRGLLEQIKADNNCSSFKNRIYKEINSILSKDEIKKRSDELIPALKDCQEMGQIVFLKAFLIIGEELLKYERTSSRLVRDQMKIERY